MENKKDFNLYPTIAISDGISTLFCLYSTRECLKLNRTDVAFGIGFVAFASMIGFLRYGFYPKLLLRLHLFLSDWAGKIGIPMIGFGYARSKNVFPEYLDYNYKFPIYLILFLIGINLLLKIKDPAIIIVISIICLILTEKN